MNTFQYFASAATALMVLSGCGGGGGGSSTASAPSTPTAFQSITVPTGFTWSTQASTTTGQVVLNNVACGSSCAQFRVTLSNFIEVDPTGGGGVIPAMSTDVLATVLTPGSASSATANFGKLIFPAGVQQVLVEVFDVATGTKLAGAKANVASLVAGSVTLAF
jgi:ABC-type transport system substrate-binding protein